MLARVVGKVRSAIWSTLGDRLPSPAPILYTGDKEVARVGVDNFLELFLMARAFPIGTSLSIRQDMRMSHQLYRGCDRFSSEEAMPSIGNASPDFMKKRSIALMLFAIGWRRSPSKSLIVDWDTPAASASACWEIFNHPRAARH